MNRTFSEDKKGSPAAYLEAVEYPVWREALAKTAAEEEAPVDVINLFNSLPKSQYQNRDEVLRDLAEGARRFAMGGLKDDDGVNRDRSNIGRDAFRGA